MIVIYKNFFRNKMVNLSKASVKHFVPDAKFFCLCLYKQDPAEYNNQETLDDDITVHFRKTNHVWNTNKPLDCVDSSQTAGYANSENAKVFSEGINLCYDILKDVDEKVLILAEDHFFTTGAVLKELTDNDFDLAHATWDSGNDANASIIGMRPNRLQDFFPIIEWSGLPVEYHLERNLVTKVPIERRYRIANRQNINYYNDGVYTNSSEVMIDQLKLAGIL